MLQRFRGAARTLAHRSKSPLYHFGAVAARMTLRASRPGGRVHGLATDMLFKAALHTRNAQRRATLLAKHNHHVGQRLHAKFGLPVSPTVPAPAKTAASYDPTLGIG